MSAAWVEDTRIWNCQLSCLHWPFPSRDQMASGMIGEDHLCIPFEPKYLHSHDTPVEILSIFAKILPFPTYSALLSSLKWQKPLSWLRQATSIARTPGAWRPTAASSGKIQQDMLEDRGHHPGHFLAGPDLQEQRCHKPSTHCLSSLSEPRSCQSWNGQGVLHTDSSGVSSGPGKQQTHSQLSEQSVTSSPRRTWHAAAVCTDTCS